MRLGRSAQRRISRLGIGLLVLGMLRVPLPQPDFHNVRHHDAPGEVCEHHDHLLRWHPDATQAQDVALLHWHWFLPASGPPDMGEPGHGPALHAHVTGWDAPTIEATPPVVSRGPGRLFAPPTPQLAALLDGLPLHGGLPTPLLRYGPGAMVRAFGATFAPRASLSCLLQRWAC